MDTTSTQQAIDLANKTLELAASSGNDGLMYAGVALVGVIIGYLLCLIQKKKAA